MSRSQPPLPVYQTLAPSRLLTPGSSDWQDWFPFTAPHGMWTFNGRVALHIGLQCLQLPPGSTVLMPNYYQGVEIDTLIHNELKLRFYRIDSRLRPDLYHVAELLDSDVSALYVIHYFGFPQDMKAIGDFARQHQLKLIEDCALSLFSKDQHTWLGDYGDIAIFSAYKSLALPHGGYLVSKTLIPEQQLIPAPTMSTLSQMTDRFQQHWRARGWYRFEQALRSSASRLRRAVSGDQRKVVHSGGVIWNPAVLQYTASSWVHRLMRHNSPRVAKDRRRQNFERLLVRLRTHARCFFEELPPDTCPLFFPVLVQDKEEAMQQLQERGIGCVNLWWDAHPACPTEIADEVSYLRQHVLELPVHQSLSETDIERVADEFIAAQVQPLT